MTSTGFHVTSHLVNDGLITPTPEARREAARALLELPARYGLLAFAIPDNHLHLLLQCDRRTAGRGANKAEGCITKRLDLPIGFEPARITPVNTQRHLWNAFHYILGQAERHGTEGDPLREASSLWDLLGLRVVSPELVPRVRSALPRLRRADLARHLPAEPLAAGNDARLLPQAVLSAVARQTLGAIQPDLVRAKAAALQLADGLGLSPGAAAHLLETTPRSARRLRTSAVPKALAQAIRLQLGLREALRTERAA